MEEKHAKAAVATMTRPPCAEITSEKYGVFQISFDHNKKVLFTLCSVSKFQAFMHMSSVPEQNTELQKAQSFSQYLEKKSVVFILVFIIMVFIRKKHR